MTELLAGIRDLSITAFQVLRLVLENWTKWIFPRCFVLCFSNFPGGSDGKESVYNAGDPDSVPGLGRSPGEGNGNPLQCYCLENPIDRGAW